jgi:hypothetical protein
MNNKVVMLFAVVAVVFFGAAGSINRAFSQGMPHHMDHPYAPPSTREMVLRARTASSADLNVEPVHGNVYAIFGAGGNITDPMASCS